MPSLTKQELAKALAILLNVIRNKASSHSAVIA
jgi:hypothetical protein